MPTMDEAGARGPLAGLVVADCSTILAGPLCTMLLADLGADVVKVEPPEGDATRAWGPPWVGFRGGGHSNRRLLPGGEPQQAQRARRPANGSRQGHPAAAARACRRRDRELPGRWLRAARVRRGRAAPDQPATRPPGHLGLRDPWPRRRAARLRRGRAGDRRAHVDHRGARTRRRRADQGRRGDQRRRERAVRDDRRARRPAGARAVRSGFDPAGPRRASGSTCRSSPRPWRCW